MFQEDCITKNLRIKDGRSVILSIGEFFDRVEVTALNGERIGEFEFVPSEFGDSYKLVYMTLERLPDYKRQGIGEAVLRFFIDVTKSSIWCQNPNNITKQEDGSEIVNEGFYFIEEMKIKNLIRYNENDLC